MKFKALLTAACVALACSFGAQAASDTTYLVVGSYQDKTQESIKVFEFDPKTADTKYMSSVTGISNPAFMTSNKAGDRIYALSDENDKNSAAFALALDKVTGKLSILNSQSAGALPIYIKMSPKNDFVLTTDYHGSQLSVYGVDQEGKLTTNIHRIPFTGSGPRVKRQSAPRPHCVIFSPDGKYVVMPDLGADRIVVFPADEAKANGNAKALLNEAGRSDVGMEPGYGPRHITFHPNGKFAYLVNELAGKLVVFSFNAGRFERLQTLTCDPWTVDGSADIHVSNDGKFVYVSRRLKEDGILIYSVDQANGTLKQIGFQATGPYPRNFALSPDGKYLLTVCRDADKVQIFERDEQTGLLKATGKEIPMKHAAFVGFPGHV